MWGGFVLLRVSHFSLQMTEQYQLINAILTLYCAELIFESGILLGHNLCIMLLINSMINTNIASFMFINIKHLILIK